MKVDWTENSLAHLRAIRDYIAQDSPRYALATIDRLTQRSKQFGIFPFAGSKVPEYDRDDIREAIEAPYRIIYRVLPQRIDVLAVIHSARQLPPEII
jgi:toxin ParE1/3/4